MKTLTLWLEKDVSLKEFVEMKGEPVTELINSKWLCDSAFMVKFIKSLDTRSQSASQFSALKCKTF